MRALIALISEQGRLELWREYTATVLYSIGRGLIGEDYPLPAYSDIAHPDMVQNDTQTGADIIERLKKRLGGEE